MRRAYVRLDKKTIEQLQFDFSGTLRAIKAPIGLFGLVLVILPLGAVHMLSSGRYGVVGSLIVALGTGFLFFVALLAVTCLAIWRPQNLLFSAQHYLIREEMEERLLLVLTEKIAKPLCSKGHANTSLTPPP
ncbi:MAG: hypothetical protein EPO21_07030 [Chloroflexota bacterium]|nr:MAG: hypothetical protein EPO21_07030 [Chloroflexota bacterium]